MSIRLEYATIVIKKQDNATMFANNRASTTIFLLKRYLPID